MLSFTRRISLPTVDIYLLARSKFSVSRHVPFCTSRLNNFCDSTTEKEDFTIKPQTIQGKANNVNIGLELVGGIKQDDVNQVVKDFFGRPELYSVAEENGLNEHILQSTKVSFKKLCTDVDSLSSDLHVMLSDLINGQGHVLDLLPYFLQHASLIFPHLKYREELSKIGDLTEPSQSYPLARSIKRKIIFHYGPTNSGKTYNALKRFLSAKRAVYCAPLKMLAFQTFTTANKNGVPCDLLTGEDIRRVLEDDNEADHISCTVEMVNTNKTYDVAVIDEIQMLKDYQRGYAWTRAFFGIAANEIHLCGEESALNFIEKAAARLGEECEVIKYKRLTKLIFESNALEKFENIRNGDCIICFSKKDIYTVTVQLDKLGIKYAIIYGTLPPGTKRAQAEIFNDPDSGCNVLIATDAIGLGMNLNIRRIIFYSVTKNVRSEAFKGSEIKRVPLSVSHALQIAGRAGRFRSQYEQGYVTTFKKSDLPILKSILSNTPEQVNQAGLSPTAEQIETFSYYLPNLSLSDILSVFMSVTSVDESSFFICDIHTLKRVGDLIKHIQLPIQVAYTFASAPVNLYSLMAQTLLVKFARMFSLNQKITVEFMKNFLVWPMKKPQTLSHLVHLEEAFDCLDIYLWLANRYPNIFVDQDEVRKLQSQLDKFILDGLDDIIRASNKKEEKSEMPLLPYEEDLLEHSISVMEAKERNSMRKKNRGSGDVDSVT
ncbi:UNVERIFIED_CONTAM: hypothetical protein PYX00_002313 [Menopon gallinae]|uniref:ATP-dependent RNA helicase SUV3 homolog, mitochondrial n=1 Tax=Menopon gallinae TaxID=328185 RepID=A0AAW2IHL6_9NEOP